MGTSIGALLRRSVLDQSRLTAAFGVVLADNAVLLRMRVKCRVQDERCGGGIITLIAIGWRSELARPWRCGRRGRFGTSF
jgi:hypothetical protein